MYGQYTFTTAFVCPLYLLTIIVGSLGNGMVIYSYVNDRSIHRTFNFLITNLAIADILICGLFTPLLFIYRVHETSQLIGITPLCEISLFLSMFSISLIYFVFPLLAYYQQSAMLRPREPRLSLSQARTVVGVFWVLCIAVSALMVLLAWREISSSDPNPKIYRCLLINQTFDLLAAAFLGYSAPLYFVSFLITAMVYIRIFWSLRTRSMGVNVSADEQRVAKMCFCTAVSYTMCWAPFLFVQLAGVFGTYTELHFNLHACSSAIGVIGSAVNPMLYSLMDPYYKTKMNIFPFNLGYKE